MGKSLGSDSRTDRLMSAAKLYRQDDVGAELPVSLTIANTHHYSSGSTRERKPGASPARSRHCIRPIGVESQTLFVNDVKL
jgi:hypothetical protein